VKGARFAAEPSDAAAQRPQLRRWFKIALSATAAILLCLLAISAVWIVSLGPAPLGERLDSSTLVVDRDGRLLRAYATAEGRWRMPASLDTVDPRFVEALIAFEDKRFRRHHGVDALALLRAAVQLAVNGRVISGGSTITMQVARLLEHSPPKWTPVRRRRCDKDIESRAQSVPDSSRSSDCALGPRHERSVLVKLREIVRAVALERTLTKDEILNLYLGLAPYGGNLEGIRAASLAYFGHEPRRLSLGEIALLVALPQSPEVRRPDRSAALARRARDRVLDRIAAARLTPADEVAEAKREPVPDARKSMPALAPHAADQAVAAAPEKKLLRLTIEAGLQQRLEDLARERARKLGPDISVALVAVDNATGEVLARVASADYFDARRAGQVDMSQALRSPGSALKPFIYGLAFEDGLVHPETLIEDRPIRYGTWAPENFDLTFQGTVTVRKALQLSLNVPAVALLDAVHASRFTARLGDASAPLVLPPGEIPGLAMGLGGLGIRLADLTMLYAGLARLGTTLALTERRDDAKAPAPRRLLDPVAAWYVGNVLIGTPPPENAAGGRIAFKTGTSYGYRDAWSVGFDGKHTIGVWVGRPDGAPVPGLIGRVAAAPILFEAFARMTRPVVPLPAPPRGVIVAATSKLPPPLQRFRPGGIGHDGETPLRIMFPPEGARLELVSDGLRSDPIALKIAGGVAPLTVLVNGVPLADAGPRRTLSFSPDGPGFVRLTVMDARGVTDSVVVRVQ